MTLSKLEFHYLKTIFNKLSQIHKNTILLSVLHWINAMFSFFFSYSLSSRYLNELFMRFVLLACTLITLGSKIPLLYTLSNRSLIRSSFPPTCDSFFPVYYSFGRSSLNLYWSLPNFLPYLTLPVLASAYHCFCFSSFSLTFSLIFFFAFPNCFYF